MSHGGNIYQFAQRLGCLPEQVLDFSANINPEQAANLSSLEQVQLGAYAYPGYSLLKQAIRRRYPYSNGVDIEVFNGASAAIFALSRSLQPKDLVLYTPLYGEYAHIAGELGCKVHHINRFTRLMADIPEHSTVVFVNPSTPDGQLYELDDLLAKWQAAHCTIIIDESFLDFCLANSMAGHLMHYPKIYVIKSLSKFYGCAGIRVGFILAATTAIQKLRHSEPAWKLSSLDMAYMQQALANTSFIEETRQQTAHLRDMLYKTLQNSGLFDKIYPGQANFLLARMANGGDGYQLQAQLEPFRILIRVCENFEGLDKSHVRFAVKDKHLLTSLACGFKHIQRTL